MSLTDVPKPDGRRSNVYINYTGSYGTLRIVLDKNHPCSLVGLRVQVVQLLPVWEYRSWKVEP